MSFEEETQKGKSLDIFTQKKKDTQMHWSIFIAVVGGKSSFIISFHNLDKSISAWHIYEHRTLWDFNWDA